MTGGFSRAIDIIQSDRGWTDEYVLSLPLCRVRQIVEIISQRKIEEIRVQARITEWQTKNLSIILVGLSQSEKQAKALSKVVENMSLPVTDDDIRVDNRSIEEVMEQGAVVDLDKQPSFEQLSAALAQNNFTS